MLFATGGYVLLPSAPVWANPTGEQVVGGAATFHRDGNNLTVNQTTDRLAVNWQDFSIAAGERTHFAMPSAASIALNRVLGGNASQIYGTLSSNGNIILVNNAGIFVGPGGVVNAASFVGSTLDIDPGQFMNGGQGGYQLHGNSYAPIVNQGNITAEKGDVFLIAQKVENRGTISAPNGRAALIGAGRESDRTEVVLHEVGGSGFAVRVAQLEGEAAQGMNGDLPDGEELLNEGNIAAAQAELSASGNIYALAIKNTGTIRAKAVVANADGTVRLDGGLGDVMNTGTMIAKNAGDEATAAGGKIDVTGRNVTASPESIITAAGGEQGGNGGKVKIDSADTTFVQGKVDVTAPSANAKGGKVELLGKRVGLMDGAKVDASGGAGGGTVLVGGDYLGGQTPKAELKDLAKQEVEPIKNAKATVMADTAEIRADATVNGDGGKIILWSDEYTGFYGQLFARGGAEGGNGGFIETSSKDNLQAFGSAMAAAAAGQGGLWLLDPRNITIQATGSVTEFDGNNPNTFTPGAGSSTADVATINNSLNNGVSVTITTGGALVGAQEGDIVVAATGTILKNLAGGNSATLRLVADRDITTAASITSTVGALAVEMVAGANGAITLGNGAITSNGGYVSLSAGAGIIFNNANAVVTTAGGAFVANADSNADGAGKFTIGNFAATLVDTRSGVNPAGSITITSAEIAIGGANGGSINAGGANIQLINSVAANAMNVATLPIGPYDISQQTLDRIITSGLLVIGGANQTGTIRVGSPDFVTGALPYGIQFGASAATPINLANDILTTGKILNFFGAVTLSPNSGTAIKLDTTNNGAIASGADVLFLGGSILNSDALGDGQPRALTITAGTSGRVFLPANIGNTTPLGSLDLTAGGGILLQGATAITTLKAGQGSPTGDVLFKSLILPTVSGTGTRTLAITTQNGGNVSFQAVGTSANPIDGLTVSSGTGTTTLNNSIFTAGGAVDLGSAVTLASGAITIDTTRLGNTAGADITFRQALGGPQALSLLGGTGGVLSFGGNVSGLTGFSVNSGASFTVDNGSSFAVNGNILIQPQVITGGRNLSMTTTGSGDIILNSGLISNSGIVVGNGANVTLSAAGNLTILGAIDVSGYSANLPGPPAVSTPGFNGGTLNLTGATVTTGAILADGDRDQTGYSRGGNGGSITITSAGAKTIGSISAQGALGSPAGRGGSITLAGAGANVLNGGINLDGGNGQAAGDSGGAAGTLSFTGGGAVSLNNGISANGGTGNGSAAGGSAGVLTFPSLTIGAANVSIIAVGGNNGTAGTGRGADGNLTFTGAVNGATAGANSLEINVAAGTVTFQQQVGNTARLGQITIQNARNVAFRDTLAADKFVQNASVPVGGIFTTANQDGTTTFSGLVTLSGTGTVLDLTGYNFTFDAGVTAATGSLNGVVNGVFGVNNTRLSLGGDMTLARGAVPGINPRVDLKVADTAISTTSGALTFGTVANPLNVRLMANTTLSTGSSGGQISFGGLLDSDATARNLTLNSGGVVTLNGLVGSLNPLASLTTDAGGSLVLAAAGTRLNPSINATGTLTFNDQVDLQSDTVLKANAVTLAGTGLMDGANDLMVLLPVSAGVGTVLTLSGQVGQATPLTSLRVEGGLGTTLGFAGTQANPSVNTTGNQYYGSAVTLGANTVLSAGSLDFLSTINGDRSLLLETTGNPPGAINLYGRVGNTGTALTQFQTSGGGILNLLATGADGSNPTIKTTGAQLFGSSLVLGEDTFLTSTTSGDFIFLNAIDSRLANQPRTFTVDGKGKVVLEAAVGGETRLQAVSLKGGTDVTVLAGMDTFGGPIRITAGNGSTSGSVVVSGNLNTGTADQLGGAVTLTADSEVIFNGGAVNTFGGDVTVAGPAFVQAATRITTNAGEFNDGAVSFNSFLDGDSVLTLNAGTATIGITGAVGGNQPLDLNIESAGGVTFGSAVLLGTGATTINSLVGDVLFSSTLNKLGGAFTMALGTRTATFSGAVGATNPFGMAINSSGGVSFVGAVRMGGAFVFNNLSGAFLTADNSTFDGNFGLTINPINNTATVSLQDLGSLIPLASLTIGTTDASVTLNGNIITSGGITLGGPTILSPDTGSEIFLQTTALGSAGGAINFRNSLRADLAGRDLRIAAGTAAITFGGAIGSDPGSRLRNLTVSSGGSFNFSENAALTVSGDISIVPEVSSVNDIYLRTTGGDISLSQGLTARPGNGPGRAVTLQADAGDVEVAGTINVGGRSGTFIGFAPDGSSFTFATAGAKGGSLSISANTIRTGSINASGSDNFVTGGNGGDGGSVTLTSVGSLVTGQISVIGGTDGDVGGVGGTILLTRTGASGVLQVETLSATGGASDNGVGAAGGSIRITAIAGNLVAPTDFRLAGGGGSGENPDGVGGTVTLRALGGDISFGSQSLELDGDASLVVSAAGNLILATTPGATPELSSGGVVITLNEAANRIDRRGSMTFEFGSAGGQFFMPSSAYLISNGGTIQIDTKAGVGVTPGKITVSGMVTSSDNVNGGRVLINQAVGLGGVGAVSIANAIETSGGTPTDPRYGRSGGQVLIRGTDVTLNRIVTSGSASLATTTVPAFGGSGGDITVTASGTITLRRNLVASGGNGLAVTGGDATGGAGGSVQLNGNVVLNSGDATRTTILINTAGGTGQGDGDPGLGGNILVAGNLTGTPTTSNTLNLQYGSGTVSLGNTGNTLVLGTLITGTTGVLNNGVLRIGAALDLDTLTTVAQGYSLELLGGGTIANAVTFLNTGYVRIGANAASETTFLGGFDALTGGGVSPVSAPSEVRLAGTVVSGDALNPGSGAGMLMGSVRLADRVVLNSNGNPIRMGAVQGLLTDSGQFVVGNQYVISSLGTTSQLEWNTIAGTTGQTYGVGSVFTAALAGAGTGTGQANGFYDLVLAAGIGANTVTFNGNVGSLTAGGTAIPIKDLEIQAGVTGNVLFSGLVVANRFLAGAGTSMTAQDNIDLRLGGSFGLASQLVLENVEFGEFGTNLRFNNRGGTVTMNGDVEYKSGPMEWTGDGAFLLGSAGTLNGGRNLVLSGAGSKTFNGVVGGDTTVNPNGLGLGEGQAITMSGGDVTFNTLTTASGILSTTAKVIFTGLATLGAGDKGTTLDANVTLAGATLDSAGSVALGDSSADNVQITADSTLKGRGAYTVLGTVTGPARTLNLSGLGTKNFTSTVSLKSILQTGPATTGFSGNVNLTDGASFAGGVVLTGNTFAAANLVDFAGLTVSAGTAAVAGNARYNFNGAVGGSGRLQMTGSGAKVFASTIGNATTGLAGLEETGGGIVELRGNVFTASTSSFAGLVKLRGISFTTGAQTDFLGNVVLESTGATLQGGGDFVVAGNVQGEGVGIQTLTLAQAGAKTFNGTVGTLKGIQQTGGTAAFNGTVRTRGNSSFSGQVELSGMTFDAQVANSSTQFNSGVTLNGGSVILGGSGNFAFANNVGVGLDSDLTLSGASANQTFTFAGNIGAGGDLTSLTQTGGKMVVGSGSSATVQTSGNVILANLSTRGAVTVDSGGSDQQFDVLGLGGNFVSEAGGGTVTYGTVSGSGNLTTTAGQLALAGAVRNSGTFAAGQSGQVELGAGGFLSDTDFANLLSSGGATFTSGGGDVVVNDVNALIGLTLVADTGDVVINGLTSQHSLGIRAAGTADLAGLTQVQTLRLLEANQLGADGLDNLRASGLGNVTLNTGGLTYDRASGAIDLQGLINVPGDVYIRGDSGVVNTSGLANPFRGGGSVVIVTRDLFNTSLQSALIPGARLVNGSAPGVGLGAVAGGVTIFYENVNNLLPYSSEFTTGTGQPYILATQRNAVPPVMMPAALSVAGAFPARVTYSEQELEMMTPEERSEYEAGLRRQSARVIFERQPGQPEVGSPMGGELPQAKVPEPIKPAPTAQTAPEGKPLAGKSGQEKGDSTQLLRVRPAKAVALRPETNGQEVMENERLAAEVNVGSAPVAGR